MPKHLGTNPNPNHAGFTFFKLVALVLLAILEPKCTLVFYPFKPVKGNLRTPPVLSFPQDTIGGAGSFSFWPKAFFFTAAKHMFNVQ